MAAETGSQLYTKLVNLRNSSGEALYERLTLAKKLLGDRGWVEATDGGGGDESTAIDRLEEFCFGDCGMSLPQMLEILNAVPSQQTWKTNRYNIRRMYAEKMERQNGFKTPVKKKEQQTQQQVQDARDRQIAILKEENAALKHRTSELEAECRKLRSTVKRMQTILGTIENVA